MKLSKSKLSILHQTIIVRLYPCLMLMLMFAAGFLINSAKAQQLEPQAISPAKISWQTVPPIPGLQFAWLQGAENDEGLYVLRVKLDAGTKIPAHTHPDQRLSTVLQGTLYVGFADQFDETGLVAINEGEVYVAPANIAHFIWAKDGPVIYQETGVGPTGTQILKK